MTTYYPSDKYYERLCYLCICCCDHKRKSYKSHASEKHQPLNENQDAIDSTVVKSSVGVSVDTDVAIKTINVELGNGGNNYSNMKQNLSTVTETQENKEDKDITPAPPDVDDANL
eukprot:314317_1